MMKAAREYYQTTKTGEGPRQSLSLRDFNAGNPSQVTVTRKRRKPKVQLSAEEQALMRLVQNGQVGSLIAYHAPKV